MTTRFLCTMLATLLLGFTGCTGKIEGVAGNPIQEDGPFVGGDDGAGGDNGGTPNPGSDTGNPDSPLGDENPPANDGGGSTLDPLSPQDPPAAEPVPEPATFLLFGMGLTGIAYYRRKRNPDGDDEQPTAL